MLSRVDSRDLTEYQAYYELEPWGEDRDDLRTGIVASTLANIHRGKHKPVFKPADFMPRFDYVKPSKEELSKKILAVFGAMAKVEKGKK